MTRHDSVDPKVGELVVAGVVPGAFGLATRRWCKNGLPMLATTPAMIPIISMRQQHGQPDCLAKLSFSA